jgi:hypothetical protein
MNETIRFSEKFHVLDRLEMHETQGGGFFIPLLIGLGIAAGASIINDWDNFKRGLQGLPEMK